MNLNQVTIHVSDIETSIQFYQTLGLHLIVKALPHYARFECPEGNSTFSIHRTEDSITNSTWIYFEVENLDVHVNNLQEKGMYFHELPNDKPWLWREARVKDPEGNEIIIYHAGSNRLNPPWRINNK